MRGPLAIERVTENGSFHRNDIMDVKFKVVCPLEDLPPGKDDGVQSLELVRAPSWKSRATVSWNFMDCTD
jgi:hypothetical protein